MSRIGKQAIELPKGVTATLSPEHVVEVKGPLGVLFEKISPEMGIHIQGDTLSVTRPTEQARHRALHGLYRALIANMVKGVSEGYTQTLELVGIGFKAVMEGDMIKFDIGFAHQLHFVLPKEVKGKTEQVKGGSPLVHLESHDKQLLGQVCAKIRSYKKPEPYKGKGIRFLGEQVRRKAGKTNAK